MRDPNKAIEIALRRGLHRHAGTNSQVGYHAQLVRLLTLDGVRAFPTKPGFYPLLSLDGPVLQMTGTLRFMHWDSEILTVNFDEGWITDHGYHQYSVTTGRRLSEWTGVLRRFLPDLPPRWFEWTVNWRRKHDTRYPLPEIDEDLVRFRTRAPWVVPRNPYLTSREVSWKFFWRKYDAALADAFWESQEFLKRSLNRRYFAYDWDDDVKLSRTPPRPHHWRRSFLNANAERLWRARERRNGRPCPPI